MADNSLIDEVLGKIIPSPGTHNQEVWVSSSLLDEPVSEVRAMMDSHSGDQFCGTSACIAGWVGIVTLPDDAFISISGLGDVIIYYSGGSSESLYGYATRKLGITRDQAQVLFKLSTNEEAISMLKILKDYPDISSGDLLNQAQKKSEAVA